MNVTPDLLNTVTSGMANTGIVPSESDVSSVCEIAGLDRSQAIILLKKWPGWQDAVTHYFENPTTALRDEASSRQWEPQDNIPYADDVGMSRPSSPSGKFRDMTEAHAQATTQLDNEQQKEDDELARAMAESMRDGQGQENGTTEAGQQFGPAQRPFYNPADWAITTVASSREVVDHPPPAKRRRVLGSPAFLRGSPETGYNAALLTIYHSIPLAREALRFPPLQIYAYGHNPEWWSGTTDENAKSLSVEQATAGDEDRRRYLAELQCLMAFLDDTTRAYGSVDALSELRYCQYLRPETDFTRLLEVWQQAAMQEQVDEPLTQVFTTAAARAPEHDGVDAEAKNLFAITGPVKDAETQAELLDKIVWADTANQPLNDVWLDKLGHIITMHVYNDEPGASRLNLVPTEQWYLDRYTPELREVLGAMRQRCYALLREKENLTRAQRRLAEMPSIRSNGGLMNVRKVLESANDVLPVAADTSWSKKLVDNSASIEAAEIQTQIDRLLNQIDAKVSQLNQKKANLDAQIKKIMSDITEPSTSSRPLRHKYVLQGVSTKPNVTYIRQLNRDLIGLEDDDEPHEIWQWWRAGWAEPSSPDNTTPDVPADAAEDTTLDQHVHFSVQKVSSETVLEAVKNEHHSAVLVYADEIAMSFRPSSLPASLRKFVEQDNRSFEDEISLNHVQQAGRGRSWSNETNSTIMDDSNPFDDHTFPAYARDATPMSTSTIRSYDGQPSPKRPRSSDNSAQNTPLDLPPAYEDIAGIRSEEMSEKKGNKIGYFAEQLMHRADQHEKKGG